jgi:hypothetical protein
MEVVSKPVEAIVPRPSPSSDGGLATDRPISPNDELATLYKQLGIDPHPNTVNRQGRPISLPLEGRAIDELF